MVFIGFHWFSRCLGPLEATWRGDADMFKPKRRHSLTAADDISGSSRSLSWTGSLRTGLRNLFQGSLCPPTKPKPTQRAPTNYKSRSNTNYSTATISTALHLGTLYLDIGHSSMKPRLIQARLGFAKVPGISRAVPGTCVSNSQTRKNLKEPDSKSARGPCSVFPPV